MPKFYSQHGEDYLVWKMLGGAKAAPGFYAEVGALDGRRFSNAYAFEQLGWRGIAIEAHPDYAAFTRKNRPGATVMHAACCDEDRRTITFHANRRGTLSAIRPLDAQFIAQRFADYFDGFEQIQVPARRLSTILEENDAPRQIDFASIDVEGNELDVLRGIDFDRYQFRALIVEANTDADAQAYEAFLVQRQYVLARRIAMNLIFCRDADDAARIAKQPVDVALTHTGHPLDPQSAARIVEPQPQSLWRRLRRRLAA